MKIVKIGQFWAVLCQN
jgi:hypothetical protein